MVVRVSYYWFNPPTTTLVDEAAAKASLIAVSLTLVMIPSLIKMARTRSYSVGYNGGLENVGER